MSHNQIRTTLAEALEQEIPAAQVDLWPAVRAELVPAKQPEDRAGESMNLTKPRHRSRLALALPLALALLALLLATPQGRSFAQSLLQLFTRAPAKTFPLPYSQPIPAETLQAPATAPPPSPLISVAEAEAQLGFAIAQLPTVPAGFDYLGVRLYGQHASLEYQAHGGGGHLTIIQSPAGFYQSDWDQVPADAIVPVKIGVLDGEFAQGAFVVFAGDTNATWNPAAPISRLRWQDHGIWFEIAKYGDVQPIEYLDQAGLIQLAEVLANQR